MTTVKPRLQGAACIVTGGSSGLGTLSPHPCMHGFLAGQTAAAAAAHMSITATRNLTLPATGIGPHTTSFCIIWLACSTDSMLEARAAHSL